MNVSVSSFTRCFIHLYKASPKSMAAISQCSIVILCCFIGYLTSLFTVEEGTLAGFLAQTYAWLFGIILFTDLGGHFNDTQKHLTFWLLFIPSRIQFIITLWLTFFCAALLYSILSVWSTCTIDFFLGNDPPLLSAILQAIFHQALGLTITAVFSHAVGAWLSSGLRQMICLSTCMILFFLSSIIPYFFSFNDPLINLLFEILPRIDLYDNRNALFVALSPFPLIYSSQITLYATGQLLLGGIAVWLKMRQEGWK